jgi:molybdenum cofactor guanylyltransferase
MADAAGIVLAGGRSSRMGSPKAALEWHGSTLLRRVAGIVARGVDGPVVVVRAPGQALPALPEGVEVVEDAREGRGPLQGLAAGLAAVRDVAPVAYASSTDVPLLHPRFVRRVVAAVGDDVDVALPHVGGFAQPLAAAYRTALADTVERLIAEDRMRPAFLFDAVRVRRLDQAALLDDPALAALDPALDSVLNLNEPGDYEAARGRPAPEVTVQRFGALRRLGTGARDPAVIRAATLGEAAAASGLTLDEHAQRRPDHARPRGAARQRRHGRVPRRRRRRLSERAGRRLRAAAAAIILVGAIGNAIAR